MSDELVKRPTYPAGGIMYRWKYRRVSPRLRVRADWPYVLFENILLDHAVTSDDVREYDMRILAAIVWWLVVGDERLALIADQMRVNGDLQMKTSDRRQREHTCELCDRVRDDVKPREIPQGDRMVTRHVCPDCARAANEIGHATAAQNRDKLAPARSYDPNAARNRRRAEERAKREGASE